MKYVKLVARPDTWFKEGTEAYNYDSDEDNKYRLTLDEWNEMSESGCGCSVRGTWVAKRGFGAVENCGYVEGQEYFDGELCSPDEFEVTIVDDPV